MDYLPYDHMSIVMITRQFNATKQENYGDLTIYNLSNTGFHTTLFFKLK